MAAVTERRFYRGWERQQWLIWQTRTLASFVAATVPIEAGHSNPLFEQAMAIGVPDEPDEEDRQPARRAPEPKTGSYERFMTTFGNPARWR